MIPEIEVTCRGERLFINSVTVEQYKKYISLMEKNDTEKFSGVMFFNKKIMQEMFGNELSLAAVGEIDAVEFLTAIKTVHFIMQNIVAEKMLSIVGCIAFDDISGALEILQEIGITGAMFDELKEIIEEMRKGVPLGYFTSQWFGNFYLKALDHYIKEELHAEHYMRYMDDMVILGKSKKKLHKIHAAIETYLNDNLDLEIKGDWQVFRFEYPVFDKSGNPVLNKDGKQVTKGRMLDFMGFQFHHDRTTIRKSNIEAARRKANHISKQDKISWYNASVMLSYMGLFKHTDTYNYYIDYIKPKINVKKLKRIVSKHSRKENEHDRLEKGDRNTAGQAGGGRQDIVAVNGLPA